MSEIAESALGIYIMRLWSGLVAVTLCSFWWWCEAPAIEANYRIGYVWGEIPWIAWMCQCEASRSAIHPDLHAQGKAVGFPEFGEREKSSLSDVHSMLHIGHVVSITLCLAPQVDKRMKVVYRVSHDCEMRTAVLLCFSFFQPARKVDFHTKLSWKWRSQSGHLNGRSRAKIPSSVLHKILAALFA